MSFDRLKKLVQKVNKFPNAKIVSHASLYAITMMTMTSHNYQSSRKSVSRFFRGFSPFLRKFFLPSDEKFV